MAQQPQIGTLGERSLHAALKLWYAQPGDQLETRVGGYVVDIVRDDLLIEIQTRNFAAMKPKLLSLTQTGAYRLRLVHPVAYERWIVRMNADGQITGRRKSPQRGRVEQVFKELVRFPALCLLPNFALEVLLVREEQILRDDGRGSWRRKGWSVEDRRLLDVVDRRLFVERVDYAALLPPELPQAFTTRDLAEGLRLQRPLAQKMAYCLRAMEIITITGKQGKAILYEKSLQ